MLKLAFFIKFIRIKKQGGVVQRQDSGLQNQVLRFESVRPRSQHFLSRDREAYEILKV